MRHPSLFLLALALSSAAAGQGPASLPRAQFIADMDGQFRKMDADRDGQVSRLEIEQFQKASIVAASRARNRQLFAGLDTDKNGQISPTEFLRVPMNTPNTNPQLILNFDSGRDGKVSLLEHRTATLANFDRLDTDKDGNVSVAEGRAGGVIK